MTDHVLSEEPVLFGEGGRLFGILTLPDVAHGKSGELPVFVFLNAGLLHRVGPFRLHVRLARKLAQMGFTSLRVDLSGTGDSPERLGLTNRQSVAEDLADILALLETRVGHLPVVLGGLCSGADNAVRLTLNEPRIVGLVLLDPVCFPDRGFPIRAVAAKYGNPIRYVASIRRRLKPLTRRGLNHSIRGKIHEDQNSMDPLSLRDLPTREELQAAFELIGERRGRVLSVFTQYALRYYNQAGQLRRVLGIDEYQQFCTELFWPKVDHTYRVESHRRRLIEEVKFWAAGWIDQELSAVDKRSQEHGIALSPFFSSKPSLVDKRA